MFGRGKALQSVATSPKKVIEKYGEVPAVIFASVLSDDESELSLFALNTSKTESSLTAVDLSGVGKTEMFFRSELCGDDLGATNSLERPDAVEPRQVPLSQGEKGIYSIELKKASWNVIRFRVM